MTAPATTDAFISYSRRDLSFVERLAQDLTAHGKTPWFDQQKAPLRGIPAGSEWWHEIEQGIEAADNFVFVISPDSVVSPYCNAEVAHALRHGKRKVTVMLCDEAGEPATLAGITHAINAIPEDEVVPEAVAAPERHLRRLVGHNWQRLSAVQYIPFGRIEAEPNGAWQEHRQALVTALEQDIERVRALSDLGRNAAAWERQGQAAGFLLRGEALQAAEALLVESAGQDPEPSPLHLEYVASSRQDENRRRRLLIVAGLVATLLIVAAIVAAVLIQARAARDQANLERSAAEERASLQSTAAAEQAVIAATAVAAEAEAQQRRQEAEDALRLATSRQLALQSGTKLDDRLDLALLLGVAAYRLEDSLEAQSSLLDALSRAAYLDRLLYGPEEAIDSLAFSPDGRLLAAGTCLEERYLGFTECLRGGIYLWDATTGEQIGLIETEFDGTVVSLAFSPDGRLLAAGGCHVLAVLAMPLTSCAQGAVALYDVVSLQQDGATLTNHLNDNVYFANLASELAFSPDGRWLAASGIRFEKDWEGTVTVWDLETREPLRRPLVAGADVDGLAFSPAGRWLVAASSMADQITAWPLAGGIRASQVFTFTVDGARGLAMHPDGERLAVSLGDSVQLWNLEAGTPAGEPLTAPAGVGGALAFSGDGRYLATSGSGGARDGDNAVALWDVETGELALTLRGPTRWTTSRVAFSPDGTRLASGGQDGSVALWNLEAPHPLGTVLSETPASCVAASPDGVRLAVCHGSDVLLLDAQTGDEVLTFPDLGAGLTDLAFSPDGRTLIAGSFDWGNNVAFLDVAAGEVITRGLPGHVNEVFAVAFSPAGDVAASGSLDGSIILWDPATGAALSEPLTDVAPDTGSSFRSNDVWSLAFSPDGATLASARGGGDILLWDVAAQAPLGEPLLAHAGGALAVAYSPDGEILATGGSDWLVRLWDAGSGLPLGEPLSGHTEDVFDLAFSPSVALLASAGWDGAVRLWDVATGQALGSGLGAGRAVNRIAFGPDGAWLVSNGDGLWRWDLRPETWLAAACRLANREPSAEEWAHYAPGLAVRETCSER